MKNDTSSKIRKIIKAHVESIKKIHEGTIKVKISRLSKSKKYKKYLFNNKINTYCVLVDCPKNYKIKNKSQINIVQTDKKISLKKSHKVCL